MNYLYVICAVLQLGIRNSKSADDHDVSNDGKIKRFHTRACADCVKQLGAQQQLRSCKQSASLFPSAVLSKAGLSICSKNTYSFKHSTVKKTTMAATQKYIIGVTLC